MSKRIFIFVLLFVPFFPAYAEELTALIRPKNKVSIVCDSPSDETNSSVMCQPKNDDKNISLIDQPETFTDVAVNSTPQAQINPTENQVEPEEILPVKQNKRKNKLKNKTKRKIKVKPKIKRSSKPEPDIEPVFESKKENMFVAVGGSPKIPPTGVKIKTFEYTVQEGDTFNTIIQKHFNENIQPGQKIIVVTGPPEVTTAPQQKIPDQMRSNTIEYTVHEGDTLSSILRKYFNGNIYGKHSPFEKLLELNKNIKATDTIYQGQKIIIPAPSEELNAESYLTIVNKLNIFLKYQFNYISVVETVSRDILNFNTDYDLESGLEYERQISAKDYFLSNIGISDFSMPRSVLSPSFVLEPIKKTQGLAAIGFRHEFTEDNSLGVHLKYRPYYFLTNVRLEYVPAPSLGLTFDNHFYHENQTLLGFGLHAEIIGNQDYPLFKSEKGSVLSFNFLYRQEFAAKDWINIEFIFQQREQASTYHKMNDKTAGFKFSYGLNF